MLRYYAVMDYLIQIYSSGLAYDLTEMESSSLFYMIVRDTVRYILTQMVLRGRQDTSSRYYVTKQYEKRIREEVDKLIRAQYSYLGDKRISKYPGCKNYILTSKKNGKARKKPGYAYGYHRICDLVLQKCTFDLAHQSVVICSERFSCFPIGTGNIFGIIPSDESWKRWLEYFDKSEKESPMLADPVSMDYIYPEMALLHRYITAENPSFGKDLKPLDILDGAFVRPVTNSDRMIAQQGAFMIYGLSRFWKTRRTLDFLIGSRGLSLGDSVSYLVSDDDSFLDDKDRTEHSKRIIEFLFETAGADVYTIPEGCGDDIRNKLRFLGVSAAAMGRSATPRKRAVRTRPAE